MSLAVRKNYRGEMEKPQEQYAGKFKIAVFLRRYRTPRAFYYSSGKLPRFERLRTRNSGRLQAEHSQAEHRRQYMNLHLPGWQFGSDHTQLSAGDLKVRGMLQLWQLLGQ